MSSKDVDLTDAVPTTEYKRKEIGMRNITIASLVLSAEGLSIQIASGVAYPTIPPVLLIVLLQAALIVFSPWRWASSVAVPAALFLVFELVDSGSAARLFHRSQPGGLGGSVGLWLQMVGVVVAGIVGVWAAARNSSNRAPLGAR